MSVGDNFTRSLISGGKELGIAIDDATLSSLTLYCKELQHWGKRINLVAKGSRDEEIAEKHFLDSLSLLPLLQKEDAHLLDVGTGAGFPGLVCKVAKPELKLTLVEPRLKRVSFLRHIVRKLQLDDVEVIAGRVEDETLLPSSQAYTHITSRAVTDITDFWEMIKRFFVPGTRVICMKGSQWQEELKEFPEQPQEKLLFSLPFSKAKRAILVFEVKG